MPDPGYTSWLGKKAPKLLTCSRHRGKSPLTEAQLERIAATVIATLMYCTKCGKTFVMKEY